MIKETVTYEDFNGNTHTEELHFNMTEFELTEFAMELPEDLADSVKPDASPAEIMTVVVSKLGRKGIVDFIKRLVIASFGVKSEDGLSFIKNEKIATQFANSMAFHTFVMELISNDDASAKFFNGIIPAKLAAKIPAELQGPTNN